MILDTEELIGRASDAGLELTANHIRRLAGESAISLEVIKERGYRSVDRSVATNYRAQGWDNLALALPGLEIPVHSPDGHTHVAQLRPDSPHRGQKYIWPQGEMMRIDVPPRILSRIRDTSDLWLTEGVFKGDSAVSHGIDCISLMGVDAYVGFAETGGRTILPDWTGINLYRRKIIIAFDSSKKLLAEAGQSNLRFKLTNRDIPMPYTPVGVFLIDQWRQIGVTVEHEQMETRLYQNALSSGNYQAGLDFNCDYMDEPNLQLLKYISASRSTVNYGGYEDKMLDELYDTQKWATDDVARYNLLRQFETRELNQAYTIPTIWWHRIIVHWKQLKGWHITPSHYVNQDLADVWIDQ